MMICIKEQYLSYNRIALLAIGLWPYQQSSNLVRLQLVLFFGSLISYITFQLSRLLFAECSLEFIIKMLSIVTFFIFLLVNYLSILLNMKAVRYLIERLQYIHNELQDGNEVAIYDKYGNVSKRLTITLILVATCGIFVSIGIQCCLYFFDITMSRNGTHIRYLVVLLSKFYIMDEKHFYILIIYYVLILHMNITCIVGILALVSIGTMLLSYLIFTCGMFKIASYRLERAMTNTPRSVSLKNGIMIYKQLICSVDIHRKAMESVELFRSNFERTCFVTIVITVCCLSLNLFRVFQIISDADETNASLILHIAVIIAVFLCISVGHYIGQKITDDNNEIFFTAYSIQWYTAFLNVQKLILFLLQRGNRIFILKYGGFFTASIECLASMISASISYFTVIYSNQK
ncbi:Or9e45 [Eciton burchellii]|nr:Or9e45 [Eciton burchellii]